MKTTASIVASALLFSVGCEKKATTLEDASPKRDVSKGNVLYVADIHEDASVANPVREVPFCEEHQAILRVHNLTPGRSYKVVWRLHDPTGKDIGAKTESVKLESTGILISKKWHPTFGKHKPGKWKWTVEFQDVGTFAAPFTLLPPTPAELGSMAKYQQAREAVFRAFAHYWLGDGKHFFTMVDTDANNSSGVNREDMGEFGSGLTTGLLQVAGLGYSFSCDPVSEADRLNGINYRGGATFSIRLYRHWFGFLGWSKWVQGGLDLPLPGGAGKLLPGTTLSAGHNMRFEFEERDGNWFVKTDSGDEFVNGKFHQQGSSRIRVFQPTLAEVRLLSSVEGATRSRDRAAGEIARATPDEIDRNSINTMTMLRGHSL